MERWIGVLCLWGVALGCGRGPDQKLKQQQATRTTALTAPPPVAGRQDDGTTLPQDLTCEGASIDGTAIYRVVTFKSPDARSRRALLERWASPAQEGPETLGDFDHYQDLSPTVPSDIRLRLVFRAEPATAEGYVVTLAEGGFTDETTVEIKHVTAAGALVLGSLTCARPSDGT
jgi:hypothetical protein